VRCGQHLCHAKEIIRANAYVKTAADLSTKYRKNVQYNMEATKRLRGTEDEAEEASGSPQVAPQ